MSAAGVPNDIDAALQQRFLALAHAVPVGIIVVNPRGRVTAFNSAAEEIFAVPAARAVGRALIETVRNFELDRRVAAALSQGIESAAEVTHVGTERRLRVKVMPLGRSDGRRDAVAIVEDLTALRDLTELRRDFVSNVSHELRTPLTAVKIMVETLQAGADAQAQATFLDSIAHETDRMIALVEELLDLARMESGRLQLAMGPVELGDLCRAAVAAQAARAKGLGIELSAGVPPAPLSMVGDRDKLFQVMLNLIDNALRNTPSGGRVTASVRAVGDGLEIAVDDTGCGIPVDALPHLFERFFVVDRSRARNISGTGLGLAIVKHIVELHGGSVMALSELNAGSQFLCRFPR